MKRFLLLCAALLILGAAPARAAMSNLVGTYDTQYNELTVRHTIGGGARGVIELAEPGWTQPGAELPVVREEAIIGFLRVDYSGLLNTWGTFLSHDPKMRLEPGDKVVVPKAPPVRPPVDYPMSLMPARVVYHFPAGHSYWAIINRGALDGIEGGDAARVAIRQDTVGEFKVVYAGRAWSYGLFSPYEKNLVPVIETLEIQFDGK